MKDRLLSPTEIKEEFPSLQYSLQDLGFLLKMGLVSGRKFKTHTVISINSLKELMHYKNALIDRQKVNI